MRKTFYYFDVKLLVTNLTEILALTRKVPVLVPRHSPIRHTPIGLLPINLCLSHIRLSRLMPIRN